MNDIPYSLKLALAAMAHNEEATNKIVMECFHDMTKKFLAIVHEYDYSDWPFVIAAMQITAKSILPILPKNGQELVEHLVSHTGSVTVDIDEMRRQAAEEKKNNGGEETI